MKTYNNVDMKGRLFNYALERKDTDKGEAISGTVTIEVDEDGTTAEGRFFARPTYNSGKPNKTFSVLEDMMAGNYRTVADDGPEADWLAMTGSIDVSYFVGRNTNSDDDLVRSQKIRGGFINPNKAKAYTNKWKLDTIITKVIEVEADEERKLDRFVRVIGYFIDDYNGRLMEVIVNARKEAAMNYILGLEPTAENPHFVAVWGQLQRLSRVVVRKNAFGEDEKDEYDSTQWVITGMNPEPYDFGDEVAVSTDKYAELMAGLEAHKQEQRDRDNDSDSGGGGGKPDLAF